MADGCYVGRRLSYDGYLCTVRYLGPLEGTTNDWLGIEWDDVVRGKHDGKYKGSQIFRCLSDAPSAASFVKPSRKADAELTLLEAIKFKYGLSSGTEADTEMVIISGKVAEEVGFDKVAREQARLSELRVVLVDQLVVSGISTRGSASAIVQQAQDDLHATCPSIAELDLGWNTIETWDDISAICAALPNLKTLRASGSRFRCFHAGTASNSLSQLSALYLDECLINQEQLFNLLAPSDKFASLRYLDLSDNGLSGLDTANGMSVPCLPSLESLVLAENRFIDLQCVELCTTVFPNLTSISIQGCLIQRIGEFTSNQAVFPKIETLNLSRNAIETYALVDALPRYFPNLTSLHVTRNPFFTPSDSTSIDPRAADKKYYLTLARISSLRTLDYTKITTRDREEGEIYYLSVADTELKENAGFIKSSDQPMSRAKEKYPRYEELSKKYNHDSMMETLLSPSSAKTAKGEQFILESRFPVGSLGARIVSATFYIKTTSESPITTIMRIPSSIPVAQVMAMLLRNPTFKNHLRPLRFRLVFESEELDPEDTTAESTTKSATYGRRLTPEQRKSLWKQWGDWDADMLIEDAIRSAAGDGIGTGAQDEEQWIEDGQICIKAGRRFRRRETEIPHALKRPWGDWLDGSKEVSIRIEPYERN